MLKEIGLAYHSDIGASLERGLARPPVQRGLRINARPT